MKKRILAAMLTASLCACTFAACGNDANSTSEKAGSSSASSTTASASNSDSQAAAEPESAEFSGFEETKNIVWMYAMMSGMIPNDLAMVNDALNEVTMDAINVNVTLNPVAISDYSNQISLAMASQEKVDLLTTAGSSIWNAVMNQHEAIDISGYLQEYGKDILDIVPAKYLSATSIGDAVYGVTVNGNKGATFNLSMRTDVVDELNLRGLLDQIQPVDTIEEMKSNFAVMDQVFEAVHTSKPEMIVYYPYVLGLATQYDNMSDGIAVLMGYDSTEIVNYYATEDFRIICEQARQWYLKGYIMQDIASTTETASLLFRSGRLFSSSDNTGTDDREGYNSSYDCTVTTKLLKNPMAITSSIIKMANMVTVTATEPEAAVAFMNMLYSNEDVRNLMSYGIEGVHYQETEDGHIDFAEGLDASTTGWPNTQPWMYGNTYIGKIWVGNDLDEVEKSKEFSDNAKVALSLGFTFDSTNVKNEIAACSSVVTEYAGGLTTGALDPDAVLDEFLSKLSSAGADAIIAEKQSQFDAWLATKNG